MTVENKFPGKDISLEDLRSKFPLAAKKHKEDQTTLNLNGVLIGGGNVAIFAGPNMVESRSLILEAAEKAKAMGCHFLRGGAFKPLTFPYRSEKYTETREEGLKWLNEARTKYNIPVITEVMEEKYLPLVCDSADILQIGSRNMQNFPFLTACAQTGKPIMLKRHFGCSLRDWLGAAEYILKEGNKNLMLCERGVSAPHTHRSTSRFLLDLQVVPAAQEVTHLPIIVDPSHATFWRNWVPSMSLAAVASGADGVMVEIHPDPPNAAVDPLQPLSYGEFNDLIGKMRSVAAVLGRKL